MQEWNLENLGKCAYEAYCKHTNWKSLASGADLPQWDGLREDIRLAWIASAKELLSVIGAATLA